MENNQQGIVADAKIDVQDRLLETKEHKFSNIETSPDNDFNVKIIGVGGAGCNIVDLISKNNNEINKLARLYAFNTDAWSLKRLNGIDNLFIIDKANLKGYGSNGNPLIAQQGIIHDSDVIKQELKNTDVLVLVTGFGKGTGSGATPELAKLANELGILTIAIVGMPSISVEGKEAYNNAFNSYEELKKYADSITTVCNERIVNNNSGINFFDLYNKANNEFVNIVNYIVDMVMKPSQMNIDFSDIRSFFKNNKFFMLNHLAFDNSQIDQEQFNYAISKQIDESISDINVSNSKSIISKLILSQKTSNNFLLSFKKACIYAIKNENVNVISGVDYNPDEKIEITYLISGNDDLISFKNLDEVKKEQDKDKQSNDENVDYDNVLDDLKGALTPTKDLQVKPEVKEERPEVNEEEKPLDPNENDIG